MKNSYLGEESSFYDEISDYEDQDYIRRYSKVNDLNKKSIFDLQNELDEIQTKFSQDRKITINTPWLRTRKTREITSELEFNQYLAKI